MSFAARRQPITLDDPPIPLKDGVSLVAASGVLGWNIDMNLCLDYQGFGVWGLRQVKENKLVGTLTVSGRKIMEAVADNRLDTYYCSKHGFIPVGETFKFYESDDLYCLRCLGEWVPHALPKVKRGLKPVEPPA